MIEDWGIGTTIGNALAYSTTAFATGADTAALGQGFEGLPAIGPIAYLFFFIVLPISGFFSDVWELLVRGLIFALCVAFFSTYIFNDVGEVIAAFFALVLGLLIAYWNESNSY